MYVMLALAFGTITVVPFYGEDAEIRCNLAKPIEAFCLKVEPEGFNLNTGRLSFYVKPY